MKVACFVSALLFTFTLSSQTGEVRKEWLRIYRADQNLKVKRTPARTFNLLTRSYRLFYSQGYPFDSSNNHLYSAPILTWIHSSNPKLIWQTSPMLYRGYREEKITEYEFANYILRSAFFTRYGRYPYRISENFDKEITYLIQILDLDTIPVNPDSLIAFKLADYAPPSKPCSTPDIIIGKWKIDKEPFYFGTPRIPPQKVQIITCSGRYFYLEEDKYFPPNELLLLEESNGN